MRGADGVILRRHAPDFMVKTSTGYRVIDVKPEQFARKQEVSDVFAWTRRACATKGWDYEVWTGADPVRHRNLLYIARGRRQYLVSQDSLLKILDSQLRPSTLGDFIGMH